MITMISLNTHPQTQVKPTFNGTITIKPIKEMSASYMKDRTRTAMSYLIKSIPDSEIIGSNYSGVKKFLFRKFRQKQFIKIQYSNKYNEAAQKAVKEIYTLKFVKATKNARKRNKVIKFNSLFKITLKKHIWNRKGWSPSSQ